MRQAPEIMVGRDHYQCFPKTLLKWREINSRVFAGESLSMEEDPRPGDNGTTEWERWEITPWWRPDGAVGGALLYSEIITGRKKIEEALVASETLLRLSQEVGRIGSWDWDLGSNTTCWSDSQCLQFGIQPNGGQPIPQEIWREKVHPEDLADIERRLPAFIESGDYVDTEYRIYGPNGLRWLNSRFHVIRDKERKAVRIIGSDMDVTERIALRDDLRAMTLSLEKRVQEEVAAREDVQARLAHAEKLKSVGELTGGIAHDFNNMLTVIVGAADILADSLSDSPELHTLTGQIGRAADRATKLTANLLAFARKQPLRPQEVDVAAVVFDVCQLLKPSIGRQITIKQIARANVELAYIDPVQLSSAIVNLGINARDAMPDGGMLTIEIDTCLLEKDKAAEWDCQSGRYTMISVSDSGTGIPKSIQPKIFEPFFSTKEVGRGTGLGLSTVFGFVKQSGGHIEVDSEEGIGATFRIYLPTKIPQSDQLDGSSMTASATQKKVILCVEDDPIVRTFVSEQVYRLGYRTIVANDAREALSIVDSDTDIDLLFSDIVMPGGMDGWQLADHVTQRRPDLPVLLTTGYSDGFTDRVASRSQLLLLPKPYRTAELDSMIRLALETPPSSLGTMANGQSVS